MMPDWWKDMKYLCYERKVESVKRNRKEIRAEANIANEKTKDEINFMRKGETPQKIT